MYFVSRSLSREIKRYTNQRVEYIQGGRDRAKYGDFLALNADFLAREVDFPAREVDFLTREVDFLTRNGDVPA